MFENEESRAVKTHQPCPHCGGHDPATLYSDGHWHCFSCQKTWRDDGATVITTERNEQRMIEMIEEGKIREIADRCITEETCKKFQVRTLVKEHKIQRHFYPYYNAAGEKVAEKVRECSSKLFSWRGQTHDLQLFGAQCQPTTGRFVVVCEGEVDAMTMWQVLGGRSTVVSVPNGCTSFRALKNSYEYLDKFDSIVLCFDGDKAGREAVEKAVMFLPQKKLKLMKLPEELKDPNEFLKAGKVQELTNYFWRAEQYTPKDIVAVSSMYDRLKDFRKTHQYIATPWSGLNDMIQGTRPGQLVVLTAGCVSADTEFFTGTGWKRIADFKEGDKVLQYDPDTFKASLVEPEAYIKAPCEWLYRFKTKYGVDMCLSPEHNVLYSPESSLNQYKITAESLAKKGSKFRGRIPTSFVYDGPGIDLSDAEIKLMLAVIADGNIMGNQIRIHIKKDRKKEEMRKILEESGIEYIWTDVAYGYTDIRFVPPRLEKEFGSYWYNCSQDQLRLICENVLKWDGHVEPNRMSFSANNKANAEFVQFAFSACGYKARLCFEDRRGQKRGSYVRKSIDYFVNITDRNLAGFRGYQGPDVIPTTDGYKYCFTVPSHCLVLRHNGCIFCTGNSGQGKSLYMKTWMMHVVRTTGFRVGGIFLEESPEETVISLMSQVAGKNLKRNDVYDSCTQEELKDYFDQVGADSKIDLFEPASNTEPDYILNKIRYLALARDCKYIILDHATFVAESGDDDIKVMSRLMKNLHELVVELDIVIIAACHTRKTATGQRSAEDGGRISVDDMKGSSGIKQYSDIVIALERNSQAEDSIEANTTTIRVLKSRDLGMKGPATRVMYEKETTRLVELGLEEVQDTALELKED